MAIKRWRATCMQTFCRVTNPASDRAEAWTIIQQNLKRACELIDGLFMFSARDTRLVLFPEFAFQGYPYKESAREWLEKSCYPLPGPITAPLQEKAREYGIYIGANHYEMDPEWPERYFNCSFLIDPRGEIILKYRRINSFQTPSPHDVMDAYFERYGVDGTFPVAKTELGNIAMIPCGEIMIPEAARVMMIQGAEVLLHPTSDPGRPNHAGFETAKVTRAFENMMYVVTANSTGTIGSHIGASHQAGNSRIIDWEGRVVSETGGPGESTDASAYIDIEGLREARGRSGSYNLLLGARFEIYKPVYEKAVFYPANSFLRESMPSKESVFSIQREAAVRNVMRLGIPLPEEVESQFRENKQPH